jgi:D-alanyl-lipoteichoic acid acyltransferase DltB (MBOAT superfamily)
LFFTFQIYGDFSGYSDIAIGTSRLFGINLKRNFAFPYFSRDIAEFWRRWHISLSTWFRDYLYIPLGGSKGGTWKKIRNIFIIFVVSGFWHGANWTFIIWGALNAIYFIPLLLTKTNRKNTDDVAQGKLFPSYREIFSMLSTFTLVVLGWVFFRSNSVPDAIGFLSRIFSAEQIAFPPELPLAIFILIFIQLIVEWFQRSKQHGLEMSSKDIPSFFRWLIYLALSMLVIAFLGKGTSFIYFQF